MSDRDVVLRVANISKLYRLGEVGTGSLAHDVNRWWHKVRGKEDPYLKIGEVNDRTKPAARAVASADGTTNHTNKREKLTTEDTESTEGKVGPKGAAPEGRRKSKYFPERRDFGDAEGQDCAEVR